jgi:hypothetical protein
MICGSLPSGAYRQDDGHHKTDHSSDCYSEPEPPGSVFREHVLPFPPEDCGALLVLMDIRCRIFDDVPMDTPHRNRPDLFSRRDAKTAEK